MDIKDRLKNLRKSKNLTQAELGENTQISLTTINKAEAGKGDLSTEQVIKLSSFFGVSADYLLTGKEGTSEINEEEREVIEIMRKDSDFSEAVKKAAGLKKKAISYLGSYQQQQTHTV
jgi:transcriptional regulator with XRE-family HTH domain